MTSLALPIAMILEPDAAPLPFESAALWPRNVPGREQARRTLFKGAPLPAALEAPSVRFLAKLTVETRELMGIEVTSPSIAAWKDALVTLWRVEIALALRAGTSHDEEALCRLLDEIADVRVGLEGAPPTTPELAAAIAETHQALLASWVSLMRSAAESSPIVKRLPAKVRVMRTVPPKRSRKERYLTGAVLTLSACAVWILMQL
jgi:hypothetical protein